MGWGEQITSLSLFCSSFLGPLCVSLAVSSSEGFCVNSLAVVRGQIRSPCSQWDFWCSALPASLFLQASSDVTAFLFPVLGLIFNHSQGPVWGKPSQSCMHEGQSKPSLYRFHAFNYSLNMYIEHVFCLEHDSRHWERKARCISSLRKFAI